MLCPSEPNHVNYFPKTCVSTSSMASMNWRISLLSVLLVVIDVPLRSLLDTTALKSPPIHHYPFKLPVRLPGEYTFTKYTRWLLCLPHTPMKLSPEKECCISNNSNFHIHTNPLESPLESFTTHSHPPLPYRLDIILSDNASLFVSWIRQQSKCPLIKNRCNRRSFDASPTLSY